MASAARKLLNTEQAMKLVRYPKGSFRKRVAMGLIKPAKKLPNGRLLFQRRELLTAKAKRDRWVESLSAELRIAYVRACRESHKQ